MSQDLKALRELLLEGQKRSKQGSYQRRAPAKEALPFLIKARAGLKQFTESNAIDPEGWRLRAQVEECLLNYRLSRTCLERVLELTGRRDNRDLKKLALMKECESKWAKPMLDPDQLKELERYLEHELARQDCDHTLRLTENWLAQRHGKNMKRVMEALQSWGGFCDCEVLSNVCKG